MFLIALTKIYDKLAAMHISKILKDKQALSFEFFPPKEDSQESVLFDTIDNLVKYTPDYVSVTYGAGGSTNNKTMRWVLSMKEQYGLNPMMHLTCAGNTKSSVDAICDGLTKNGINNLFALRGDPSNNPNDKRETEFNFANELVEYVAANYPILDIGVAGYPEKHPTAPDFTFDINNLKRKIDAGASFIITQLFFDNELFYRYLDRIHSAGINVPVVAGIMPVVSLKQIKKFTEMCGTSLPPKLIDKFESLNENDVPKAGEEHAAEQCLNLIQQGVNGIHYYTLNKYTSVHNILNRI